MRQVRGKGGMHDFPIHFNTSFPSRFCFDDDLGCGCANEDCPANACFRARSKERARKLFGASRLSSPLARCVMVVEMV
jgi:hypothetical protein